MDHTKLSIGLCGIGGFLNIIIGLTTYFRFGFFAWDKSLSFCIFIGIIFIPSAVITIVGALVEFKSLISGSLLCLIGVILIIVMPIIVNYYYFNYIVYNIPIFYFPTIFIIVGGILGILEYKKMKRKKR